MDVTEALIGYASNLAVKYTGQTWDTDFEFKLYLQLSGLRFENLFEITKQEEAELRRLSQLNDSWITLRDNKLQPIKYFDWLITYCEWHYSFIWNLQPKPVDIKN